MTGKDLLVRTQDRKMAARALEAGVTGFLTEGSLPGLGRIRDYRLQGDTIHRNGAKAGTYVELRNAADEARVRALKGRGELVIVDAKDWKVIPFENLIAALGGKPKLYAVAHSPQEAELFLTTLERGVDGIVASPRSTAELEAYRAAVLAPQRPRVRLVSATVTRIEPAGMGERVCVDTTSLFEPGEGLLVGSSSQGFFLVAAECFETEFVAARPFRVNAGAVHSYLLNGERTTYLSEVRAGTRLEAVRPDGSRREVIVGRAKIETRPLLLVEAEAQGRRYTAILQNAETIRVSTRRGRPKSVSQLKVGDRVLLHPESGARHFGMKVEERIEER